MNFSTAVDLVAKLIIKESFSYFRGLMPTLSEH
jgi:hypothetical protein